MLVYFVLFSLSFFLSFFGLFSFIGGSMLCLVGKRIAIYQASTVGYKSDMFV